MDININIKLHTKKYFFLKLNSYNIYINNLININDNEENYDNFITTDIYKIILNLIEKYKSNTSHKITNEPNDSDACDLKKFLYKLLDIYY